MNYPDERPVGSVFGRTHEQARFRSEPALATELLLISTHKSLSVCDLEPVVYIYILIC